MYEWTVVNSDWQWIIHKNNSPYLEWYSLSAWVLLIQSGFSWSRIACSKFCALNNAIPVCLEFTWQYPPSEFFYKWELFLSINFTFHSGLLWLSVWLHHSCISKWEHWLLQFPASLVPRLLHSTPFSYIMELKSWGEAYTRMRLYFQPLLSFQKLAIQIFIVSLCWRRVLYSIFF